jgi:hypothetical protein
VLLKSAREQKNIQLLFLKFVITIIEIKKKLANFIKRKKYINKQNQAKSKTEIYLQN